MAAGDPLDAASNLAQLADEVSAHATRLKHDMIADGLISPD